MMLQAHNLTDMDSDNSSSDESYVFSDNSDDSYRPKGQQRKKKREVQLKKRRNTNPSWWDFFSVLVEYGSSKLNYSVPAKYQCTHDGRQFKLGNWLRIQRKNFSKLDVEKQDSLSQLVENGLWGDEDVIDVECKEVPTSMSENPSDSRKQSSSSSTASNVFNFKKMPSLNHRSSTDTDEYSKIRTNNDHSRLWYENESETEKRRMREEKRKAHPSNITPKMTTSFASEDNNDNKQLCHRANPKGHQWKRSDEATERLNEKKKIRKRSCPIGDQSLSFENTATQVLNAGLEDVYLSRHRAFASSQSANSHKVLTVANSRSGSSSGRKKTFSANFEDTEDLMKIRHESTASKKAEPPVHRLIDLTQVTSDSDKPRHIMTSSAPSGPVGEPAVRPTASDSRVPNVILHARIISRQVDHEAARREERVTRNLSIDSPASRVSSSSHSSGSIHSCSASDESKDGRTGTGRGGIVHHRIKKHRRQADTSGSLVDQLSLCEGYKAFLYTETDTVKDAVQTPETHFIGVGQFKSVVDHGSPALLLLTLMNPKERGANMVTGTFTREVLEEECRVVMSDENAIVADISFYEESKGVFRLMKQSRADIKNSETFEALYGNTSSS